MKRVFIIALLVLCCVPLFAAATVFYKQLPAMFLVNLGETFYKSHSGSAKWTSGDASSSSSTSFYYDNQIIAVLGVRDVTDSTKDITFSVTLESGNWVYLLDTADATISRPFGLDLIVKGYGGGTTKSDEQYIDDYGSDGHIYRMGLQGEGITSNTGTTVSFTIDADDVVNKYAGTVWFDVCLVLPTLTTNGTVTINNTTYTAKSSDKLYTSGLSIKVQIGDATPTQYNIDLTGAYKSSSSSSTSSGLRSMMTILPNASAFSLNIQGIGTTNATTIATYSYLTESKYINDITYEGNNAYLFLSSTSDQTATGEKFKLRRVRDDGSYSPTDNMYNSVTFVAYLVSEDGTSVEFDGSAKYSSYSSSSLSITPSETTSQNGQEYVRWFSNGDIKVKISPQATEDPASLTAGKYTETIYVHVVSPE